jgi:hypothetical protein
VDSAFDSVTPPFALVAIFFTGSESRENYAAFGRTYRSINGCLIDEMLLATALPRA